jgi:hypothetical protein
MTVVVITAVLVGGGISYLAYRAARRSESRPLRLFSVGFGTLTVGFAVGGVAAALLGVGAAESVVLQGVFVVVGLGLLLRSLYVMPTAGSRRGQVNNQT